MHMEARVEVDSMQKKEKWEINVRFDQVQIC